RGHIEWQTLINLQLQEPVSNDVKDLVGVGNIYCRHQVDALRVKTFFDHKGCLGKTLRDFSFQLAYRLLHSRGKRNRAFLIHYVTPLLAGIESTNVRARVSPPLAWGELTSSGR